MTRLESVNPPQVPMPIKYESRKFVDLILRVTSKWANWDPPRQINVGDYGTVNQDTGEFECEGSIYGDSFQATAAKLGVNLKELGPKLHGEELEIIVTSKGMTATKVEFSPQAGFQNVVEAGIRVQLQCGGDRGAALILYKPQYWSLPHDPGLYKLLQERPDPLDRKYIVTEVVKCPGYVLYLSNKTNESFEVQLGANMPLMPNVSVGGQSILNWSEKVATGILRRANGTDATYIPLFKLKQPPAWFWKYMPYRRGEARRKEDFSSFEDVLQPWNWLDEDGVEQEYYDPVDSDEEEEE
ncbi:hypothetical protein JOM56_010856 [Amanita muscaria]